MDDVLVYFAKCCNPHPQGSLSSDLSPRGRGVTVHRSDCRRAFEFDQMRKVDVEWNTNVSEQDQERTVRIQKSGVFGRAGLVKNAFTEAFSIHGINISNANIRTTRDKKAISSFEVGVKNTSQLNQVILELQKIKGVIGVSRQSSS